MNILFSLIILAMSGVFLIMESENVLECLKRKMKCRTVLQIISVFAVGMMAVSVTGCQSQKEPEMAVYTSKDGTYSVTMPEGLKQTDVIGNIMVLEASGKASVEAMAFTKNKSEHLEQGKKITALEDFGKFFESAMSISAIWSAESEKEQEGMERCIYREGIVKQNGTSFDAVMVLVESRASYGAVLAIGNKSIPEKVREKISIAILKGEQKTSSVDFIDGMKAVLDRVNGANLLEVAAGAEQAYNSSNEEEKKNLQASYDRMHENAGQALEESWDITDAATLIKTKDDLLGSGHNRNALEFLEGYGVTEDMDREAVQQKIVSDNLDEENAVCLLAAYDARAAFGENAILAWDLSRIPTIMGMGCAAGYITYEEALDHALEAAKLAQQSFDSWEAFNQSYLYGYSYWSGESLEDPSSGAYERQEIVKELQGEENGPFSVDWDMKLEKEW